MAPRYVKETVILAGLEPGYGGVVSLSASTNAMRVRNLKHKWMQPAFTENNTDYVLSDGSQGKQMSLFYTDIAFDVAAQASGTRGTPPAYGPLLKACGLKETIVANTSVTYTPDSYSEDSLRFSIYQGKMLYVSKGGRGDLSIKLTPGKVPLFSFKFKAWCPNDAADVSTTPTPSLGAFPPAIIADDLSTILSVNGLRVPIHERSSSSATRSSSTPRSTPPRSTSKRGK